MGNKFCKCKDWKENIDIVEAPLMSEVARNLQNFKKEKIGTILGYTGKKFIFCPWCSKKLLPKD